MVLGVNRPDGNSKTLDGLGDERVEIARNSGNEELDINDQPDIMELNPWQLRLKREQANGS
ncbi:hypothetical protein [Streptomyces sp. NPDC088719]|uniref:hypothetical protein n=1 Tax=Streptomyces sp. NPDC088719 TaxID=3365872 RepID=UPI0038232508